MPPKPVAAPPHIAKHYILDTNVLIHDPGSPFQFKNNFVWIPVEVFEELDRLLGIRNSAAHPGMLKPNALDVQQYATKLGPYVFSVVRP